MTRYILRRLAIIPVVFLGVHFLGFAYAHLVLPTRAFRNPFIASQIQSEPLWPTYIAYLQRVVHLDLGSMPAVWGGRGEAPLGQVILQASLASFGLLAIALALSVFFGLIFGLRAARADPPSVARWMTSLSTVGMAMPTFFIASLFYAAWFLYVLWGRRGAISIPLSGFGWDSHLIMPALVLMARPAVQIAQVIAGLLSDELGKQYVVAARSFGHSWRAIRQRHALFNILAPIVLAIAASVRLLVGELIVVEWFFKWPGLGNLLAQTLIPSGVAVGRGLEVGQSLFLNPPVVAAVLAVFTALFLLTDLVASVLVRVLDPRLRD